MKTTKSAAKRGKTSRKRNNRSSAGNLPLPKLATSISGLDEILNGGLPTGRTTAFVGGAGCGKSVFATQIAVSSAALGKPAIFRGFEQTADDIRQDARSLGWDIPFLEGAGSFTLSCQNLDAAITDGDFDLSGLVAQIRAEVQAKGADLLVLDALDVVLELLPENRRAQELRNLNTALRELGLTVILTVKDRRGDLRDIDFMVDCVVRLDQRIIDQVATRRLRVSKYRGSASGRNEYPFVIMGKGVKVIPISSVGLKHQPPGKFLTTGIPRFDDMLGGGIRQASSVLIAGTPGTCKTTLGATFARSRGAAEERVLWLDFEQSETAMLGNVRSAGIDLMPLIKSGHLVHRSAMPESMGAEEHLIQAFGLIEEHEPRHVVIDAISACARMGSGRAAYEYALRLMDHCKTRGVTCVLLNQTSKFMDITELSGIEISSMVDTAIALNLIQQGAELNRLVLVVKSRGTGHSHQFREFKVTDRGIEILDACLEMDGQILTGTARQAMEEMTASVRQQKLEKAKALEREAANLRAEMGVEDGGRQLRGAMRGADGR